MEILSAFNVTRKKYSGLAAVDFGHLEFGKYFSDHMLVCDFAQGEWKEPQLIPFSNLSLSPATLALHYGQTVFEGMKAFRMDNGKITIFRIDRHFERFNRSLSRMCMPEVPYELFEEGLKQLVSLDYNWVPRQEGSSLYIRPFMFASEAKFGVKPSDEYRFLIITGPVGPLYSKPIRVKVETRFIRAAKGGTGFAKCGGNYGGAMYPTRQAKEQGYDNVIWTDARDHKFIEESGVMNLMFVINDTLVTPPLSDSILDGVTRDSLLRLAGDLEYAVEERPVSVEEIITAFEEGKITEVFGAGTAAVVVPIEVINIGGIDYSLPPYTEHGVMNKLKKRLDAIRYGTSDDIYGWNTMVD